MAAVRQRKTRGPAAALALLGALVVGCGDPLVDNQYRGVRIWQVSGGINGLLDSSVAGQPLRLALFYTTDPTSDVDPARLIEHRGASTGIQLGGAFNLGMFEPPGESLMVRTPNSAGTTGYAIGRLVAYADTNRDGQRQVSEPLVGIEPTAAYLYLPDALPAGKTPTSDGLPAGMTPLLIPQACSGMGPPAPPPPNDPGDCGVPLGQDCRSDTDCNPNRGGRCLKETNAPWPGGYCTIAENMSTTCRPARAVFYRAPRYAAIPDGTMGFYLRPCSRDTDCVRMMGMDTGYQCDLGLRACRPGLSTMLRLRNGNLDADSFCGQAPPR
jgi:hypothetical protein